MSCPAAPTRRCASVPVPTRRLPAGRFDRIATDFNLGFGEVAAMLLRVCRYAVAAFDIQDLLFGVYQLAKHHAATGAEDAIEGTEVTSPTILKWLLFCTGLSQVCRPLRRSWVVPTAALPPALLPLSCNQRSPHLTQAAYAPTVEVRGQLRGCRPAAAACQGGGGHTGAFAGRA